MTQPRPVRNTHLVGKRLTLTPAAQRELVAEAMAQATLPGERTMTGVWGGVEVRFTPSQRAWYLAEMARTLRAARNAAQAATATPEPSPLAAPERHAQPEQRHYAQEAQTLPFPAQYATDTELVAAAGLPDADFEVSWRQVMGKTAIVKRREAFERAEGAWAAYQAGKRRGESEAIILALYQTWQGKMAEAQLHFTDDGPHAQPEQQQAQALRMSEEDARMEAELEALDALEAAARRPASNRRPLTEWEQEERWRQDDLMEQRAAFMREDY